MVLEEEKEVNFAQFNRRFGQKNNKSQIFFIKNFDKGCSRGVVAHVSDCDIVLSHSLLD